MTNESRISKHESLYGVKRAGVMNIRGQMIPLPPRWYNTINKVFKIPRLQTTDAYINAYISAVLGTIELQFSRDKKMMEVHECPF